MLEVLRMSAIFCPNAFELEFLHLGHRSDMHRTSKDVQRPDAYGVVARQQSGGVQPQRYGSKQSNTSSESEISAWGKMFRGSAPSGPIKHSEQGSAGTCISAYSAFVWKQGLCAYPWNHARFCPPVVGTVFGVFKPE